MKKFNGKVIDEMADAPPLLIRNNREISAACDRFLTSRGIHTFQFHPSLPVIVRIPRRSLSRFQK